MSTKAHRNRQRENARECSYGLRFQYMLSTSISLHAVDNRIYTAKPRTAAENWRDQQKARVFHGDIISITIGGKKIMTVTP